jgi:lipopolysaccharide biosynthesis regulator YciM
MELAQLLSTSGHAVEAKAVMDEGVAAKMVDPAKGTFRELIAAAGKKAVTDRAGLAKLQAAATAATVGGAALSAGDALYGTGDYAGAATQYIAALQKGSVDVNVVNTRLGMALALAGRRAEAEAALRTVTGARADLASLWLSWLARRG